MISDKEAIETLELCDVPDEVIEHCRTTREVAMELCDAIRDNNPGLKINKRLVSLGCLLHDIGRSKTHGVDHGIKGAAILRALNVAQTPEMEKLARICETHIGAGIDTASAKDLGLPPGDYTPKSLEEKIVAYCDNMVSGTEVRSPKWAAIRFEKKFGKNSEITKKIVKLNRFFEKLLP